MLSGRAVEVCESSASLLAVLSSLSARLLSRFFWKRMHRLIGDGLSRYLLLKSTLSQILSNWKWYSNFILKGGGSNTFTATMGFLGAGSSAILARRFYEDKCRYNPVCREPPAEEILPQIRPVPPPQSRLRKMIKTPFVPLVLCLIVGSLFLPSQPWRQMTSTLMVDVVWNVISVLISKTIRAQSSFTGPANFGSNPLGNLNYNPRTDPYYISNLDSPIDEFIAQALDGVQFRNIVHVVLESVRADCFPFQEESAFVDYIKANFPPHDNGSAITTANVTPFIDSDSVAEHTISWETMWAVVPFSHKALLGRRHPSFT
jgi:hypothetical protein